MIWLCNKILWPTSQNWPPSSNHLDYSRVGRIQRKYKSAGKKKLKSYQNDGHKAEDMGVLLAMLQGRQSTLSPLILEAKANGYSPRTK